MSNFGEHGHVSWHRGLSRVQKKQSFRAGEHGPCARPRAVFYRVLSSGHQTGKAAGIARAFFVGIVEEFGLIKKTGLPLVTTFYGLDVNKLARLPQWQKAVSNVVPAGGDFYC